MTILSFAMNIQTSHFTHVIQVAFLKDTIARKDTEIEQLQLMKDKAKSPSLVVDRNGASMPKNSNSNLGLTSLITINRQSQLTDPQSYGEVNGDAVYPAPTDLASAGLDEADYVDNVSEDGLSVGETEYSVGSAAGVVRNFNSDRTAETTMYSQFPIALPSNQHAAVNCFLSLQ